MASHRFGLHFDLDFLFFLMTYEKKKLAIETKIDKLAGATLTSAKTIFFLKIISKPEFIFIANQVFLCSIIRKIRKTMSTVQNMEIINEHECTQKATFS